GVAGLNKKHRTATGLSLGAAATPVSVFTDVTRRAAPPVSIPPADMAVSIIIPTKDRYDLLRACIESLSLIRFPAYEVIIIDNGSESPEMQAYLLTLTARPDVRVVRHDIP